jgi:hypothetical protein
VIVASLKNTFYDHSYRIGTVGGHWHEVFNSDITTISSIPSRKTQWRDRRWPPLHGLPASAGVTLPANGIWSLRDLVMDEMLDESGRGAGKETVAASDGTICWNNNPANQAPSEAPINSLNRLRARIRDPTVGSVGLSTAHRIPED